MTPACASFYGAHANRDLEAEGWLDEAEDCRELRNRLAGETGLDRGTD